MCYFLFLFEYFIYLFKFFFPISNNECIFFTIFVPRKSLALSFIRNCHVCTYKHHVDYVVSIQREQDMCQGKYEFVKYTSTNDNPLGICIYLYVYYICKLSRIYMYIFECTRNLRMCKPPSTQHTRNYITNVQLEIQSA